jgi:hypothetical protein
MSRYLDRVEVDPTDLSCPAYYTTTMFSSPVSLLINGAVNAFVASDHCTPHLTGTCTGPIGGSVRDGSHLPVGCWALNGPCGPCCGCCVAELATLLLSFAKMGPLERGLLLSDAIFIRLVDFYAADHISLDVRSRVRPCSPACGVRMWVRVEPPVWFRRVCVVYVGGGVGGRVKHGWLALGCA